MVQRFCVRDADTGAPRTTADLRQWVRENLDLDEDSVATLFGMVEQVIARQRQLIEESKYEAIRALSEGFAAKMERLQHQLTEKDVREALKTVKDPELGLDLVVLGLVYDVKIENDDVEATISLTSPMCPVADQIVQEAREAIAGVEGVGEAEVELTFDPPWTPDRISPLIRSSLGI